MPTVGLSMIVKNGADTLRQCLESARGIVSQIVVADTGSTDATCEIAREFGATILSVPWENHFAKARNAALQPVTTDWVLVLDADEEIDRDAKKLIVTLLDNPRVGGYIVPIRNYMPNRFNRGWDRVGVPNDYRHERAKDAPSYVAHENCRLFRRDPRIYFEGRVHELVEPQILSAGFQLLIANFCIHHFGQLIDQEARTRKHIFYRNLMRTKAEENPEDYTAWTQLGLHEFECFHEPEEALCCFKRAIALKPDAPEPWLFTGMVYLSQGRHQDALDALQHDQRKGSSSALCEDLKGDAFYGLGRLREARLAYRRAVRFMGDNPLLESKLGYTEINLGQINTGLSKLRHAARQAPDNIAIFDRLLKACIIAKRLPEAAEAAEKLASVTPHPKLVLRAASIRAQLKQWDRTCEILTRGLQLYPNSPELQRALDEARTATGAV
jgi:hypothetical protein